MFIAQHIRDIANSKGIKIKDLYKGAGLTQGTLYTILSESGNPTSDKLEAIADFLECAIDDFFNRKKYDRSSIFEKKNNNIEAKEIEYLKALLKEKEALLEAKDQLLQEKERMIEILMNKQK